MSRPRTKDLSPATAPKMLPPNSHFKEQESHNLLCVSLGASESWGPLSPQSTTPPFRQDPNRAKGGSPYGRLSSRFINY